MDYKGRVGVDLNAPWVAALVEKRAQEVAARARAMAPKDSGGLASSIAVFVNRDSGVKGDRVTASVVATARNKKGGAYGATVEFGSSDQRGSFFLRRAAG